MNMKLNKKKYFVGLDIGTSKICALIAENINNEKLKVKPKNIVEKKIKAKFKDGVLNITIPKAEEVKPSVQQIAIS